MRLRQPSGGGADLSFLTTNGDMVVRGLTDAERLASGAVNEFLMGQGAGLKPIWADFSFDYMNKHVGYFTRSVSGGVSYTGLSFSPKMMFFLAKDTTGSNNNWSVGWDYKTKKISLFNTDGGTIMGYSSTYSIYNKRSTGNVITGAVTNWLADGFYIYYTLTGTSSVDVRYLALG
ncbi:MAG: hypothetical protein GWN93_20825 [Deltaproteobacteria bacterium]|nr:hypothetical protein [Deltaproteobacteria bacterium]